MADKKKHPRYTSPAGIAVYPNLVGPDKFNKVGVKLRIPAGPAADAFEAQLQDIQEFAVMAIAVEQGKPPKAVKSRKSLGERDAEDNSLVVKFHRPFGGISKKTGEAWQMYPLAFFARNGNPIDPATLEKMGTGTELRVSFEAVPTFHKEHGAGARLSPLGIQVLKLVEYTKGAEAFGFDTTDEDDDFPATPEGFEPTSGEDGDDTAKSPAAGNGDY